VRKVVQAGAIAGACGLVMAGAGIAHAQQIAPGTPQPSLLARLLGADVGSATATASSVLCNNHLVDYNYKSPSDHSPHPCINGPVRSGNSQNSGNFVNHGNPSNSGNLSNSNGSTNSSDTVTEQSSYTPGLSSNGTDAVQNLLTTLNP
jgi:hypothetical protein